MKASRKDWQPGFINLFETAIERIKENPDAFTNVIAAVKRILLKRFPCKVFYSVSENTIFILGVTHSKRSNEYIRKRLRSMK